MSHRPDNPFVNRMKAGPIVHQADSDWVYAGHPERDQSDYVIHGTTVQAADTPWTFPGETHWISSTHGVDPKTGYWDPDLYVVTAEAFTGPGHDNGYGNNVPDGHYSHGLFPPTWPSWEKVTALKTAADALADQFPEKVPTTSTDFMGGPGGDVPARIEGHYDWTHPHAQRWIDVMTKAAMALADASREARGARSYTDPDTGLPFLTLVRNARGRARVQDVVQETKRWETGQAIAGRPVPTLDDEATVEWTISDLLADGGTAMVIGGDDHSRTDVVRRLADAVTHDEEFLGHAPATADQVVIIDTDHPAGVLKNTYAAARDMGAVVLPFRGRVSDLDVRIPAVRTWLAGHLPARSILIVDSLPTILGVLDVAETAADAGGYLAGWNALAAEADLAGLVIVHASPASDPSRPRGHGTISSWPDAVWAVAGGRHPHLAVTGAGEPIKLDLDPAEDADSDPAKPGEEEEAADAALSQERLCVLDDVRTTPGQTTSQVAASLGVSVTTATRHLEALKKVRLVTSSKKKGAGRSVFWHPVK